MYNKLDVEKYLRNKRNIQVEMITLLAGEVESCNLLLTNIKQKPLIETMKTFKS